MTSTRGTTMAPGISSSAAVTSTSWPGTRAPSRLGKVARSSMVPALLTALLTKSTGAVIGLAGLVMQIDLGGERGLGGPRLDAGRSDLGQVEGHLDRDVIWEIVTRGW